MQKFLIGAYWNARPDSLEKCVDDARLFFSRLAETDPLLANWYERGSSRKVRSEHRIDTANPEALKDMLLKGRNRRDVGHDVMEDLGFRLGLWNGADSESSEASLNVHCGSYNQHVGNNVLIHLPHRPGSAWVAKAQLLLELAAEVWQPSWAGIMSKKAVRERQMNASRPFVDWMVYVPRSITTVPSPARVEIVEGLGSIIVMQPDPPTGTDSNEQSRIQRVEEILAA